MRAEFLRDPDRQYATVAELQQALDAWVVYYNTERPHQALGMRPPIDRFQLAAAAVETVVAPAPVPASTEWSVVQPSAPIVRLPGVQRWVDQHGLITLAGFGIGCRSCWPGSQCRPSPPSIWCRSSTVQVLVAEHVQRRKPDTGQQPEVRLRQGSRRPRRPPTRPR